MHAIQENTHTITPVPIGIFHFELFLGMSETVLLFVDKLWNGAKREKECFQ